ncbi:putative membrane protein [Frondihabitans sp. PhB188]|uniref:DUF2254 domain-containing protein n=1 Tax=Frondihabitans sp. PhB188 TaxID=2485200 RepID=UPI000F965237|nr:DUF2254 domain-containing protein [Frondihabitans sp. PhB188]ROQ30901.1 putative membrane protein [Frondihabitans sp. PhB188]
MRSFVLRARESFWFLPAVFGIAAIILAEVLVTIDQSLVDNGGRIPFLDALSASAGRSILSIIGTSMLTVAGTSFSITISVLATTSSTYGPRLVRNFLADRANQIVLAVFTSTFLYALVVLRAVRSETDQGSGFVPTISIHLAVLFGVLDVAVLVFFIHHIADSVQITTLQKRVQADLLKAINLIYPQETAENTTSAPLLHPNSAAEIPSKADGYVEQIDLDELRDIAIAADCVLDVIAMPGTFVIPGDTLVQVIPADRSADVTKKVQSAFAFGTARTPHQDVRFALQQLVEVAVRGLASGTNDPYTAVTALDLASTALVPLLTRPCAATALTCDDTTRVMVHWPPPDDLIRDVFAGITTYGLEHPLVIDAATRLAHRLLTTAPASTTVILTDALATMTSPS